MKFSCLKIGLFFLAFGLAQQVLAFSDKKVVKESSDKIIFKKGSAIIKSKKLNLEVALSDKEHEYGLMNRTEISDDFGMLFVFSDEDYRSFWMKNTFVDLSIAYIDRDYTIKEVIDMKASKSSLDTNLPVYPSTVRAKYALEVKQGWFKKNGIKVGEKIKNLKY